MSKDLAVGILNSSIKEMMNSEGAAYTLGFLESILARSLDVASLNKVNNEMVEAVKSL